LSDSRVAADTTAPEEARNAAADPDKYVLVRLGVNEVNRAWEKEWRRYIATDFGNGPVGVGRLSAAALSRHHPMSART
jgi:hypothetical protein